MAVNTKDIQALRQSTGAGMLDCKKTLEETDGDLEAAAKLLRERGLAASEKRAERSNEQGAIGRAVLPTGAALVQVRCETDFVAKSDAFVALVDELAVAVAERGEDAAGLELGPRLDELKITLKENIELGRIVRYAEVEGHVIDSYLHVQNGRGVNGVLVELDGGDEELAHDVAVHIAFAKPRYLRREDVPADEVAAERATLETISRNEGKPEAALPKIVEGRLNGFFKDVVLLEQPFAKDDKQTVAQHLGSVNVVRFAQLGLGSWSLPATPDEAPPTRWRRIILKVSGEAFAGSAAGGIDGDVVAQIADEIAEVRSLDVDVAVVVGGGNIWRGLTGAGAGMDRAQSDYMGMLATVINGLALQDALERRGQPTRVQTAVEMAKVAEPYVRRRATRHLEKGRVVIFAGGTGNPYFTTDTTAALRAAEIEADAILKGTHSGVDGVYSADPRKEPTATRFDEVSYLEVLNRGLQVMDSTAITFCMDNKLPIVVFDLMERGNVRSVLEGKRVGTLVR